MGKKKGKTGAAGAPPSPKQPPPAKGPEAPLEASNSSSAEVKTPEPPKPAVEVKAAPEVVAPAPKPPSAPAPVPSAVPAPGPVPTVPLPSVVPLPTPIPSVIPAPAAVPKSTPPKATPAALPAAVPGPLPATPVAVPVSAPVPAAAGILLPPFINKPESEVKPPTFAVCAKTAPEVAKSSISTAPQAPIGSAVATTTAPVSVALKDITAAPKVTPIGTPPVQPDLKTVDPLNILKSSQTANLPPKVSPNATSPLPISTPTLFSTVASPALDIMTPPKPIGLNPSQPNLSPSSKVTLDSDLKQPQIGAPLQDVTLLSSILQGQKPAALGLQVAAAQTAKGGMGFKASEDYKNVVADQSNVKEQNLEQPKSDTKVPNVPQEKQKALPESIEKVDDANVKPKAVETKQVSEKHEAAKIKEQGDQAAYKKEQKPETPPVQDKEIRLEQQKKKPDRSENKKGKIDRPVQDIPASAKLSESDNQSVIEEPIVPKDNTEKSKSEKVENIEKSTKTQDVEKKTTSAKEQPKEVKIETKKPNAKPEDAATAKATQIVVGNKSPEATLEQLLSLTLGDISTKGKMPEKSKDSANVPHQKSKAQDIKKPDFKETNVPKASPKESPPCPAPAAYQPDSPVAAITKSAPSTEKIQDLKREKDVGSTPNAAKESEVKKQETQEKTKEDVKLTTTKAQIKVETKSASKLEDSLRGEDVKKGGKETNKQIKTDDLPKTPENSPQPITNIATVKKVDEGNASKQTKEIQDKKKLLESNASHETESPSKPSEIVKPPIAPKPDMKAMSEPNQTGKKGNQQAKSVPKEKTQVAGHEGKVNKDEKKKEHPVNTQKPSVDTLASIKSGEKIKENTDAATKEVILHKNVEKTPEVEKLETKPPSKKDNLPQKLEKESVEKTAKSPKQDSKASSKCDSNTSAPVEPEAKQTKKTGPGNKKGQKPEESKIPEQKTSEDKKVEPSQSGDAKNAKTDILPKIGEMAVKEIEDKKVAPNNQEKAKGEQKANSKQNAAANKSTQKTEKQKAEGPVSQDKKEPAPQKEPGKDKKTQEKTSGKTNADDTKTPDKCKKNKKENEKPTKAENQQAANKPKQDVPSAVKEPKSETTEVSDKKTERLAEISKLPADKDANQMKTVSASEGKDSGDDEGDDFKDETTASKKKRRRKKNKKTTESGNTEVKPTEEKAKAIKSDVKAPKKEAQISDSSKEAQKKGEVSTVKPTSNKPDAAPEAIPLPTSVKEVLAPTLAGAPTTAAGDSKTSSNKKKKNKKKKPGSGAESSTPGAENDNSGQKKTSFESRESAVKINALAHHLSNCCCICKKASTKDKPLLTCSACSLACYCGRDHQLQHWPHHKQFCNYIASVLSEERPYFFTPAQNLSQEERRQFKLSELQICQKALKRPLTALESALILHPRACYTCFVPAFQNVCQQCHCINYCCPEHLPVDHDLWCSTLRLKLFFVQSQEKYGSTGVTVPQPSKISYPRNMDMKEYLTSLNFIPENDMCPDLYLAHLSELATYPLTVLQGLEVLATHGGSNPTDYQHLVVHIVGAEDVYECCQILKWKYFFVNLLPKLKTLHLVFIGCELTIDDEKVHVAGRLVYEFHAKMTYLEYCKKCYIKPSIVCAFNSGLYRNTGFKGADSWGPSLFPMLTMNASAPLLLTSYTHMEAQLEIQRLREVFPNNLQVVQQPMKNPFASFFPNHNLVSEHECPVAFRNYFLSIVRHSTYSDLVNGQ